MANNGSATVANEILTELLGESVDITPIDLDGGAFDLPDDSASKLYDAVGQLSIDDITSGEIGGDGFFDKLMAVMTKHLAVQYDKSRITGGEYAKVYIEMTNIAMAQSIGFAVQREQAYWQSVTAQTSAISARVQLETTKNAYIDSLIQYATSKANLSLVDAQYGTQQYQIDAVLPGQVALTAAQTNVAVGQKDLVGEQIESQRAQTLDTRTDGTTVAGSVGKQKSLYEQQIVSYQRNAETTAAKIFSDVFITLKTIDDGYPIPACFSNNTVTNVFTEIVDNNGLGSVVADPG